MRALPNDIIKKVFCYTVFFIAWFISTVAVGQVKQGGTSKTKVYSLNVIDDLLSTEQEKETATLTKSTTLSLSSNNVEEDIYDIQVIGKEELLESGALSIPEALRQVPGVLVQQLSFGVYEVSLQADRKLYNGDNPIGVQNAPILVMVDFVPINQSFNHRITWESIPVAISEIAQIEVITANQPVWYGSTAVSGVIHIIRSQDQKRLVNAQVGQHRNLHVDAKMPIKLNDKFDLVFGGYFNFTDRSDNELYLWNEQRYIQADSALLYQANAATTNLFSSNSSSRVGGNLQAILSPKENSKLIFNFGTHFSEANLPWLYLDQISDSRRRQDNYQGSLSALFPTWSLHSYYQVSNLNLAEGYAGSSFNVQSIGANLKKQFNIGERFSLTGHLDFVNDTYTPRVIESEDLTYTNLFESDVNNQLFGTALSAHFQPSDQFAIQLGGRVEQSNLVDDLLISYQASSSYKFGKNSWLRLSLSHSPIKPTLEATQANRSYRDQLGIERIFIGNDQLQAAMLNQAVLSYRGKLFNIANVTVKLFANQIEQAIVQTHQKDVATATETLQMINSTGTIFNAGVSISSSLKIDNVLLKLYTTIQEDALDGQEENTQLGYTPRFYGGLTASTKLFSNKLQFSGNIYFVSSQKDSTIPNWTQTLAVPPLFSLKIDYKVWEYSSIYLNLREIGGNTQFQYPFADQIPSRILLGGTLKF